MRDIWDWLCEWFWLFPVFLMMGFVVWIFWFLFTDINRSEERREAAIAECGLYPGDRVVSVLDNIPGMVLWTTGTHLGVRFSADSLRTDTHLLGRDGDLERGPYAVAEMRCFELRKQ